MAWRMLETPTLEHMAASKEVNGEAAAEFKACLTELASHGDGGDGVLHSAMAGILGKAGDVLHTLSPAFVFAAPAALALALLLRQIDAMAANKPLCGELRERVAAVGCVLGEVSDNEAVARTHFRTLQQLRRRVIDASALVQKVGAMGGLRSFISAGSNGAQLQAFILGLTQWTTVLTAAIGAGMEARLAVHMHEATAAITAELAAITQRDIEALRMAVTGDTTTVAALLAALREETAIERDAFVAELQQLGVTAGNARRAADEAAARGAAQYEALMAGTRQVLRAVEGGVAKLDGVLAAMRAEQAAEAHALQAAVARVAEQVGGMAHVVEGLQAAMVREMRAVLAQGGSMHEAGEAAYKAGVRAAAARNLHDVERLPKERVVVFEDVVLGEGSFGKVYGGCLVLRGGGGRPVAIKKLKAAGSVTREQMAAFYAEIKLQYSVSVRSTLSTVYMHAF